MSRIFKFLFPKSLRKRIRLACFRRRERERYPCERERYPWEASEACVSSLGPIDPKDFEGMDEDEASRTLFVEVLKRMPARQLTELFSHNDIGLTMFGFGPPTDMPRTPEPPLIDPNHPAFTPDPEGRCYINELPVEMLDTIFGYLRWKEKEKVKNVCSLWWARLTPYTPNSIPWIEADSDEEIFYEAC